MDSKIIVEQLLKGSSNIDLMKIEIHRLVKMVKGFAFISHHCTCCSDKSIYVTFKSECGSCEWIIRGHIGSMNKEKNIINIECQVTKDLVKRLAYEDSGNRLFPSDTTQNVYEGLPVLIKGVIEIFPEIESFWKYLVEASKAKL